MMLTIGSIVWGVRDVARAIEFWRAALNYKPLREPSEDWAILVPVTGEGQQMAITIVSSDPPPTSAIISISMHPISKPKSSGCCLLERSVWIGAIPKARTISFWLILMETGSASFRRRWNKPASPIHPLDPRRCGKRRAAL
ncbi:VOC family protein [Rhizobium laguerreae]|uniref:VOC family protein n=1 Tax=Rhizobium laguerreae TaxID=1076926 RepID=UPI00406BC6E5